MTKNVFWVNHIFTRFKGPTTVKLAKSGFNCKIVKFTNTGPLIWCDNPQVRLSKILYINNNNFHNLGRSQMCAGACYVFRSSKPHSRTLWAGFISSCVVLSWNCVSRFDSFDLYFSCFISSVSMLSLYQRSLYQRNYNLIVGYSVSVAEEYKLRNKARVSWMYIIH